LSFTQTAAQAWQRPAIFGQKTASERVVCGSHNGRDRHNTFATKGIMEDMSKPGPARKVSDEEILKAIMQITAAGGPFAATTEVGDKVGLAQPVILDRLKQLKDQGVVDGKQVGSGGWGWWVC
jgi:hypothetical protein